MSCILSFPRSLTWAGLFFSTRMEKWAYHAIVDRGNCFRQARSSRRALLLATLSAFLLLPTAPIAQAADRWIDGDAPFGIYHPSLSRHFWRGAPLPREQKINFGIARRGYCAPLSPITRTMLRRLCHDVAAPTCYF